MNYVDHITDQNQTEHALVDTGGRASIAPTESTSTSSKAYAVGDLFYYEGILYKVTTAIAQGDSIVTSGSGQNVEVDTVSGELGEIQNQIDVVRDNGAVNIANVTLTSQTKDGVTWTVNPDKSIATTGTTTADTYIVITDTFTLPAGSYRMTGCPEPISLYSQRLRLTNAATEAAIAWDDGEGVDFTLNADTDVKIYIRYNSGVDLSGKTFYPMIYPAALGKNVPYQPHTETNPVLTQKVSALEETGAVNHLLNNATSQVLRGVTWTVAKNGTITAVGEVEAGQTASTIEVGIIDDALASGKACYLSGCPAGGSDSAYFIQYSNGVDASQRNYGGSTAITVYNKTTYPNAKVYITVMRTAGYVNLTFKPMVSLISGANYQPHAMTNRELSTIEDITSEFSYASGITARTDWTRIIRCGNLISVQMRFTTPSTVTDGIAVMSVPRKYAPKIAKQINNAMVCGGLMSTTSWTGAILGILAWYNNNFILMSTGWQTSKECVIQFNYLIN